MVVSTAAGTEQPCQMCRFRSIRSSLSQYRIEEAVWKYTQKLQSHLIHCSNTCVEKTVKPICVVLLIRSGDYQSVAKTKLKSHGGISCS